MKLAYPFDVVYSNCPYTVDWLNEVEYKTEKYKLGYFILNEKYIPTESGSLPASIAIEVEDNE